MKRLCLIILPFMAGCALMPAPPSVPDSRSQIHVDCPRLHAALGSMGQIFVHPATNQSINLPPCNSGVRGVGLVSADTMDPTTWVKPEDPWALLALRMVDPTINRIASWDGHAVWYLRSSFTVSCLGNDCQPSAWTSIEGFDPNDQSMQGRRKPFQVIVRLN